jgi:hypothetical protein
MPFPASFLQTYLADKSLLRYVRIRYWIRATINLGSYSLCMCGEGWCCPTPPLNHYPQTVLLKMARQPYSKNWLPLPVSLLTTKKNEDIRVKWFSSPSQQCAFMVTQIDQFFTVYSPYHKQLRSSVEFYSILCGSRDISNNIYYPNSVCQQCNDLLQKARFSKFESSKMNCICDK